MTGVNFKTRAQLIAVWHRLAQQRHDIRLLIKGAERPDKWINLADKIGIIQGQIAWELSKRSRDWRAEEPSE